MAHKQGKDPLEIESLRQRLASDGNFKKLRETYDMKFKISSLNRPEFWDKLLNQGVSLDKQGPMTRDRVRTALKFLPETANKILDVGAGYGFIEELIRSSNKKMSVYGIDISPLGIKILKDKFNGKFKVGDIRKIPYSNNSFDAVFALEVLEHISPNDTFLAFQELRRTLRPGGTLIVSVPTNEIITDFSKNPSGHLRVYTPELIKAELLLAGFRLVKWKKLYAFRTGYKLKSIFASLLPSHFLPNNVVIKAAKA